MASLFETIRDLLFPPKKVQLSGLPKLYRLERVKLPGESTIHLHLAMTGWMSWSEICAMLPAFAPIVPDVTYDANGFAVTTYTDPHVWVRRYEGSLATWPKPASQLSVECAQGPSAPQLPGH